MATLELPNGCTIEGPGLKVISLADWRAEAVALFGEDMKNWKFKCCNCGHVRAVLLRQNVRGR